MTPTYSNLNLFMRSLIFSVYSIVSIIIYSFLCLLAWPFPLRYRLGLIRYYLALYIYLLKKICLIDYVVHGLENIPKDQNGIIFCKHQSTWETFFLPTVFHNLAIILKKELLWVPFFGYGLAVTDPIAISRSNKSSAMQQIIEKGTKCLKQGRWVLVFPEGTRIPAGSTGKYRLGGARLAKASGYPFIAVAHNAGRFWPRRSFIKIPGTIHVVIGPLMSSEGKNAEEILAQVKGFIEDTMQRIDRPFHKSASD